MTLGEFIKTQKGISSFGLYLSGREDNIIETQLSLTTALDYQKAEIDYVNYFIVDINGTHQGIRACIYIICMKK